MAGNYPDVPGHRMPYDRDGSTVAHVSDGGVVSVYGETQTRNFNQEVPGGRPNIHNDFGGGNSWGIMFPELRDLNGYHIQWDSNNGTEIQLLTMMVSTNTTNLVDGTWTTVTNNFVGTYLGIGGAAIPFAMRTSIQGLVNTGIKAIKWRVSSGGNAASDNFRLCLMHLYGKASTDQNPDRLRFWLPATDAEIGGAYFDLGDVARGSTNFVTFRIKNNSSTLTAQSVAISREALTDTTPTNVGQQQFSLDGATYAATVNIGNLAPGAISNVIYMRRDTSASAALSLWWTRFVASATAWV